MKHVLASRLSLVCSVGAALALLCACDINITGPDDDSGAAETGDAGDDDTGGDDGAGADEEQADEESGGEAGDDAAEGGPSDDGPADDGPADDGPADDGPADDGPADDGPADDGPADDGPADDGPADDGPADDGPADDGGMPGCQDDDPVDEMMCLDATTPVPGCDAVVSCGCEACPCLGLQCAENADCQPIRDCALAAGCSGFDCYGGGACTAIIDAHGGPVGVGAAIALELEACVIDAGCGSVCN
ncbi:MAG: hypothetical protein AAF721_19365 [Myxococcota bacterium]